MRIGSYIYSNIKNFSIAPTHPSLPNDQMDLESQNKVIGLAGAALGCAFLKWVMVHFKLRTISQQLDHVDALLRAAEEGRANAAKERGESSGINRFWQSLKTKARGADDALCKTLREGLPFGKKKAKKDAPPVDRPTPPVDHPAPPVDRPAPPVNRPAPPVDPLAPPVNLLAPGHSPLAPGPVDPRASTKNKQLEGLAERLVRVEDQIRHSDERDTIKAECSGARVEY